MPCRLTPPRNQQVSLLTSRAWDSSQALFVFPGLFGCFQSPGQGWRWPKTGYRLLITRCRSHLGQETCSVLDQPAAMVPGINKRTRVLAVSFLLASLTLLCFWPVTRHGFMAID